MPRQKKQQTKQPGTITFTTKPVSKGVSTTKSKKEKVHHSKRPIFEKRPKNFGIGGDVQPPRDLTRFVRWPKYVRLQRQRQVLLKRLKVPPSVNQFKSTLHKADAKTLFALLDKYRPETRAELKKRERAQAAAGTGAKPADKPKYPVVYGLNHITSCIELRTVKLVIIAHDVDPLELVLWLPTLCRKKDIPYVIVKGRARLGKVVHMKTASALAITEVDQKDQASLALLTQKARDNFNSRYSATMKGAYGGKIMGSKHRDLLAKADKRRLKKDKEGK